MDLKDYNFALESEVDGKKELESKINDEISKIRQTKGEVGFLEDLKEIQQSKIRGLERRKTKLEQQIANPSDLDRESGVVDNVQNKIDEVNNELNKEKEDDYDSQIQEAKKEAERQSKKSREAIQKAISKYVEKKEKRIEEIKKIREERNRRYPVLKRMAEKAKEAIAKIENSIKDIQEEINSITAEINRLDSVKDADLISELQADLSGYQAEMKEAIGKLTKANQDFTTKQNAKLTALREIAREENALSTEQAELEASLDELREDKLPELEEVLGEKIQTKESKTKNTTEKKPRAKNQKEKKSKAKKAEAEAPVAAKAAEEAPVAAKAAEEAPVAAKAAEEAPVAAKAAEEAPVAAKAAEEALVAEIEQTDEKEPEEAADKRSMYEQLLLDVDENDIGLENINRLNELLRDKSCTAEDFEKEIETIYKAIKEKEKKYNENVEMWDNCYESWQEHVLEKYIDIHKEVMDELSNKDLCEAICGDEKKINQIIEESTKEKIKKAFEELTEEYDRLYAVKEAERQSQADEQAEGEEESVKDKDASATETLEEKNAVFARRLDEFNLYTEKRDEDLRNDIVEELSNRTEFEGIFHKSKRDLLTIAQIEQIFDKYIEAYDSLYKEKEDELVKEEENKAEKAEDTALEKEAEATAVDDAQQEELPQFEECIKTGIFNYLSQDRLLDKDEEDRLREELTRVKPLIKDKSCTVDDFKEQCSEILIILRGKPELDLENIRQHLNDAIYQLVVKNSYIPQDEQIATHQILIFEQDEHVDMKNLQYTSEPEDYMKICKKLAERIQNELRRDERLTAFRRGLATFNEHVHNIDIKNQKYKISEKVRTILRNNPRFKNIYDQTQKDQFVKKSKVEEIKQLFEDLIAEYDRLYMEELDETQESKDKKTVVNQAPEVEEAEQAADDRQQPPKDKEQITDEIFDKEQQDQYAEEVKGVLFDRFQNSLPMHKLDLYKPDIRELGKLKFDQNCTVDEFENRCMELYKKMEVLVDVEEFPARAYCEKAAIYNVMFFEQIVGPHRPVVMGTIRKYEHDEIGEKYPGDDMHKLQSNPECSVEKYMELCKELAERIKEAIREHEQQGEQEVAEAEDEEQEEMAGTQEENGKEELYKKYEKEIDNFIRIYGENIVDEAWSKTKESRALSEEFPEMASIEDLSTSSRCTKERFETACNEIIKELPELLKIYDEYIKAGMIDFLKYESLEENERARVVDELTKLESLIKEKIYTVDYFEGQCEEILKKVGKESEFDLPDRDGLVKRGIFYLVFSDLYSGSDIMKKVAAEFEEEKQINVFSYSVLEDSSLPAEEYKELCEELAERIKEAIREHEQQGEQDAEAPAKEPTFEEKAEIFNKYYDIIMEYTINNNGEIKRSIFEQFNREESEFRVIFYGNEKKFIDFIRNSSMDEIKEFFIRFCEEYDRLYQQLEEQLSHQDSTLGKKWIYINTIESEKEIAKEDKETLRKLIGDESCSIEDFKDKCKETRERALGKEKADDYRLNASNSQIINNGRWNFIVPREDDIEKEERMISEITNDKYTGKDMLSLTGECTVEEYKEIVKKFILKERESTKQKRQKSMDSLAQEISEKFPEAKREKQPPKQPTSLDEKEDAFDRCTKIFSEHVKNHNNGVMNEVGKRLRKDDRFKAIYNKAQKKQLVEKSTVEEIELLFNALTAEYDRLYNEIQEEIKQQLADIHGDAIGLMAKIKEQGKQLDEEEYKYNMKGESIIEKNVKPLGYVMMEIEKKMKSLASEIHDLLFGEKFDMSSLRKAKDCLKEMKRLERTAPPHKIIKEVTVNAKEGTYILQTMAGDEIVIDINDGENGWTESLKKNLKFDPANFTPEKLKEFRETKQDSNNKKIIRKIDPILEQVMKGFDGNLTRLTREYGILIPDGKKTISPNLQIYHKALARKGKDYMAIQYDMTDREDAENQDLQNYMAEISKSINERMIKGYKTNLRIKIEQKAPALSGILFKELHMPPIKKLSRKARNPVNPEIKDKTDTKDIPKDDDIEKEREDFIKLQIDEVTMYRVSGEWNQESEDGFLDFMISTRNLTKEEAEQVKRGVEENLKKMPKRVIKEVEQVKRRVEKNRKKIPKRVKEQKSKKVIKAAFEYIKSIENPEERKDFLKNMVARRLITEDEKHQIEKMLVENDLKKQKKQPKESMLKKGQETSKEKHQNFVAKHKADGVDLSRVAQGVKDMQEKGMTKKELKKAQYTDREIEEIQKKYMQHVREEAFQTIIDMTTDKASREFGSRKYAEDVAVMMSDLAKWKEMEAVNKIAWKNAIISVMHQLEAEGKIGDNPEQKKEKMSVLVSWLRAHGVHREDCEELENMKFEDRGQGEQGE